MWLWVQVLERMNAKGRPGSSPIKTDGLEKNDWLPLSYRQHKTHRVLLTIGLNTARAEELVQEQNGATCSDAEILNRTGVTEFLLLGFPSLHHQKRLMTVTLLASYLVILVGNLLIISLVLAERDLYRPMYFFLGNLSSLEIFLATSVIPKAIGNLLTGSKAISYPGCLTQCYFYSLLGYVEFVLLAVISYDRYVAICHLFQYPMLMNSQLCLQLLLGSWTAGFLATIVSTVLVARMPFCNANHIDHFFCDSVLLIKLSCAETQIVELTTFVASSIILLGSLGVTAISYFYIINTILRLPSVSSWHKTFSTCSSHFIFVILGYGSCIFMYVQPSSHHISYNKAVALLNTVVTPLMSRFIFSLRNQLMKDALKAGLKRSVIIFRQHSST
ncbi:olfactory receptor 6E1-like [Phoenicopterus ruber ruber]